MVSWFQRLQSLRHGFWLALSERCRWSRGIARETPALQLTGLGAQEAQRIAALQERYQLRFEATLNAASSRRNYEYLDILERAWQQAGLPVPAVVELCDVGCASFWYAAALQAFFRPQRLSGVEVEGYRLQRSGHSRRDYAAGYLERIPGARFLIADYTELEHPADLISAWFPFVTPVPVLAWRLPLRLLRPERLFAQVAANLAPQGRFVMVNHGPAEAAAAQRFCAAAGLVMEFCTAAEEDPGVLSTYRAEVPQVSCWRHRGAEDI